MADERTDLNGLLIDNGCLVMVQAPSTKIPVMADGVVGLTCLQVHGCWIIVDVPGDAFIDITPAVVRQVEHAASIV